MNKKVFYILNILLCVILFICILSPTIYASTLSAEQLHSQANNFIQAGQQNAKVDANKIAGILRPLASLLLGIGTVVLVIVTAVMGVKYISSTPETRGKLKTQLIGVAVSAVVLFGAYGIWSLAYKIMTDLTS